MSPHHVYSLNILISEVVSTALSLSHRHPTTKITLLDSSPLPNPHGSSVDTSRIVRADYSHHVYANLAAKAIHHWRSTEWGHEGRYTQNGLLLVYPEGAGNGRDYAMKSYENVRKLEGEKMVELLPGKEEVLRAAPAYGRELNVAGGYVNWGSGWSDAEASVRFIAEKLQKEGKVSIKTDADVLSLLYDDSNNVTGVSLANGTALYADLTILATGAWTTKLIDLRGRTLSTGQALAYMRISDEEQSRLAHMPTILNFTTGIFIIPPRNNLLKIARHGYGYHNPVRVSVPGKGKDGVEVMEVSLPEKDVPVPTEGQEAFRDALKQLLPSLADRPFVSTRVCWYTDT